MWYLIIYIFAADGTFLSSGVLDRMEMQNQCVQAARHVEMGLQKAYPGDTDIKVYVCTEVEESNAEQELPEGSEGGEGAGERLPKDWMGCSPDCRES